MAYHASDWNLYSIGVELCNRGDAYNVPNYYDGGRFGPRRDIKPVKINGNTLKAFDYTPAQKESFSQLCRALLRLLPNLPAEYPQSSPGEPLWDTLKDAPIKRESYAGYIGHYHINTQKWDPGVVRLQGLLRQAARRVLLPGVPADRAAGQRQGQVQADRPRRQRRAQGGRQGAVLAQRGPRRRRVLPGRPVGRHRAVARRDPPHRQARRRRVLAVPRPAGRGVHGARVGDRLVQLRAAPPRDDAWAPRGSSSTRCTCTSPTRPSATSRPSG